MTTSPDLAAVPWVDEVHLLGIPPLANFVDHVTRRSIAGHESDESALIDQWRTAANHYQRLQETEAGIADLAGLDPIPPEKAAWVDHVAGLPDFAEAFGDLPVAFAMVELDRLVVYQQHVSLSHADAFTQALKGEGSREDAVFAVCLPREPRPAPILSSKSGRGKFVFQSELSDVRAFSPRLFSEATAKSVMTSNGPAHTGIAIPIGYGARHLNIVRLGQRMVLNTHSHTLRQAKSCMLAAVFREPRASRSLLCLRTPQCR